MDRKIIDIIKEEVAEWNTFEKKIPHDNYKLFKLEDFDYLVKYGAKYKYNFKTTKFIDFCASSVLQELASKEQRKSIWYWENVNDNFIVPQLKYLSELILSYNQLKDINQNKTAFIVFRSYIEISSQLYACLLDLEFYRKYTSNSLNDEYREHWFRHLKPEKVLSVLRRLNQELKSEYKKTGTYVLGDLRGFIYPFESIQRDELYQRLSAFSHGKYDSIEQKLNKTELNELNWRISEFLMSSINLLEISTDHYLAKSEQFDSRKHVILQQVWHSIKYKN